MLPRYKTYERIKELCESKGITVSALERKAGLKPNTIKRWAESRPMADPAWAVANALEVSMDFLLKDEEL